MGSIIDISQDFIDEFIQASLEFFDYQSTQCTIYYPPVITPCSSCAANYHDDGTEFNALSDCSACGGVGNFTNVATGVIDLVLFWNPSQWKKLNIAPLSDLRIPAGAVLAQGKMTDLIKFRQADKFSFNSQITQYQGGTFEIFGEPVDQNNVISDVFFWSFLNRTES